MINEFGKTYNIFTIPTSPSTLMRILDLKQWECNPDPMTTPCDEIMEFSEFQLTCPQGHEFVKTLHGIARYPYCPVCGE